MFYSSAWDNEDDVDDWDTDTDAINTENIRSGKSAAESLGGSVPLNAAEAAKVRKKKTTIFFINYLIPFYFFSLVC